MGFRPQGFARFSYTAAVPRGGMKAGRCYVQHAARSTSHAPARATSQPISKPLPGGLYHSPDSNTPLVTTRTIPPPGAQPVVRHDARPARRALPAPHGASPPRQRTIANQGWQTPAPSRFLVPKRHGDGSHKPNRGAAAAAAAAARSGQFTPTPRFASTSTQQHHHHQPTPPPLPAFSTPAAGPRAQAAARDVIVDSSPAASQHEAEQHRPARGGGASRDAIEVEDSPLRGGGWLSWVSVSEEEEDEEGEGEGAERRSPKRLRVDGSPFGIEEAPSSPLDRGGKEEAHGQSGGYEGGDVYDEYREAGDYHSDGYSPDDAPRQRTTLQPTDSDDSADAMATSDPEAPSSEDDLETRAGPAAAAAASPAAGHPVFLKPPQFKPAERAPPPPPSSSQLPEAFSPRRPGAAYVPGGLAAELRDWLVQIKGDEAAPPPACAQLVVEDVRRGRGMVLVRGRRGGGGPAPAGPHDEVRIILAGAGRPDGLAAVRVGRGDVVGVFPPAWDVGLDDDERWAVACDWMVTATSHHRKPG